MKQGPLVPPRKKWNGKTIRLICGVVAVLLFAGLYSRYGGPWKLEPQKPQPDLIAAFAKSIADDQEISIPKIAAGASAMRPLGASDSARWNVDTAGSALGWAPISNGNDPGQLLADVTSLRLFRKVERYATFQYIPKPHTMDDNRNKPVLYELINDAFKCSDSTAVKLALTVYYEDGTQQRYFPWGYAGLSDIWVRVKPGTALSSEMSFVCAVELTSQSTSGAKLNEDRIFGTWQVDKGARGRIAGPIVISETQIAWTDEDERVCTLPYRLASRATGSTYPGASMVSGTPDDAYTTYVLELGEHHCALGMNSFTITLESGQPDAAKFSGFFLTVQGSGTIRRVLQK
jgi:hypothetical protein